MSKKEIIKAVTEQIVGWFENCVLQEQGFECFKGWLEDGDVFFNNGMSDEDIASAMELADKIASPLENVMWEHLIADKEI